MRHTSLYALQWGGARARSSTIAKRPVVKKVHVLWSGLIAHIRAVSYSFSEILSSLMD